MQEPLLHFIWHRKLFDTTDLSTTQGQRVEIIHPGIPNQDQGPDFLQARIRLDENLWAGHVEIHTLSSMWFLHGHEKDPHYNNVILHVVWTEDKAVHTAEGIRVPCIALGGKVDKKLLHRFHQLMHNEEWVPCGRSCMDVSQMIRTAWLERLMAERLENKTIHIHHIWERCGKHYEQAFFVLLARQMGSPANSDAMENLALKVPLNILQKHGDRIDQIEAILFGVGGMLTKEMPPGYPSMLRKEFDFLKKKYNLGEIAALQWKFMRMRPVHFPTIRIAQLATIVGSGSSFISLLSEIDDVAAWINIFRVSPYHDYWKSHYHFKSPSAVVEKRLGLSTAHSLIINVVVPFMFYYGKMQGLSWLRERALLLLSQLPAESNSIMKQWAHYGWRAEDAGQAQALLQLKKFYCDERKCLQCAVGMQLIK